MFKHKTNEIALLLLVPKLEISNKSTKILCNQDSQDILSKNHGSFEASVATYRFRVMIVILITGTEIELWKHSKLECGNIIIIIIRNRYRTCSREAGIFISRIFGFFSIWSLLIPQYLWNLYWLLGWNSKSRDQRFILCQAGWNSGSYHRLWKESVFFNFSLSVIYYFQALSAF